MEKSRAISLIQEQLNETDNIKYRSSKFDNWFRDTRIVLVKVFGEKCNQALNLVNIRFTGYQLWTGEGQTDQEAFFQGMQKAQTLLESCITEIDRFWPEESGEAAQAHESGWQVQCERIINRFHIIARQLTHRYSGRETIEIKDEYDVQDLVHSLLRLYFDDIRPEEWTPKYAGANARMDFLLKKEKVVIETKMTRSGLSDRQIGEELIIDIEKYKNHPDCETLLCFIYDPGGFITNPKGLETDLRRMTPIRVQVYVRPN